MNKVTIDRRGETAEEHEQRMAAIKAATIRFVMAAEKEKRARESAGRAS